MEDPVYTAAAATCVGVVVVPGEVWRHVNNELEDLELGYVLFPPYGLFPLRFIIVIIHKDMDKSIGGDVDPLDGKVGGHGHPDQPQRNHVVICVEENEFSLFQYLE